MLLTDIRTLLENAGHDSSYWFDILQHKFHTTEVQKIQALDEGNLQTIANCAKDPKDISVMLQFLISLKYEQQTDAPCNVEDTSSNEVFQMFVENTGLNDYFPKKLSIQKVMQVQKDSSNHSSGDAVDVLAFLKRLLMLDNTARDTFDSTVKENQKDTGSLVDILAALDDDEATDENNEIHPLDYFLVAYLCCDYILRQAFIQKLFACRLAIPILYPRFTDNFMELLHWPLRSIVPEWRKKDGTLVEKDAASTPCHFVSFCRVGKFERYRKSKLINEIISDVAHATFYHWDCPGGDRKRQVSEGMIEGTWYIPRGTESDIFPDLTMILNLRGDSLTYIMQFDLLFSISSVIVMVLDTTSLANDKFCNKLRSLLEENKLLDSTGTEKKESKIILLIDHNSTRIDMKQVKASLIKFKKNLGHLFQCLTKVAFTFDAKVKIHKNADEIKKEMREEIKSACNSMQPKSYSEVVNNLSGSSNFTSFKVDEYAPECEKGKRRAATVLKHVKERSAKDLRQEIPLQGELWQRWSSLLKQSSRPSRQVDDSVAHSEKLHEKMREVREEQFALCMNPSPLMRSFVGCITESCEEIQPEKLNASNQVVKIVLQMVKLHFDIQSRLTLPELQNKYQMCWKELQNEKDKKGINTNALKVNVKVAEKDLANASFGLEHLLRELGQMYEAIQASRSSDSHEAMLERMKLLPNLVASLVLSGHPLELMDGDAANIPLSWLKAVIASMKHLAKDKKIFVVSVLGIQSSGKSTLLNTMFGLQFAVSAGRCTRGVYMQLVHVDEKDNLPFDYVCVIDTEGLRATELGFVDHDHDNELATLVIGLGDVTIMNIKGENYAEMKDVIQIAVHAFLRMKMAFTSGKDYHRCVFIHQNVPATSAKEKMNIGCQKLQESLDMMTAEAAEQENNREISTFNQVIQFDCHKDVWFFPDLWHGDPPMAYANPGYSSQVREVTNKIFSEMSLEQKGFLLFSDLSQRIEDLWKGIMADDFVFSFRNSLEVKAYNGLENKCHNLIMQLEENVLQWEKCEAEMKIEACESKEETRHCETDLDLDLGMKMTRISDELETELVDFCKTNTYSHITIQWQQHKVNYLKHEIEKQKFSATEGFKESLKIREVEIFRNEKNATHVQAILKAACSLAQKMKESQSTRSDTLQKTTFERLWETWIRGQNSQNTVITTSDRIKQEVVGAIKKRLSSNFKYALEELTKSPIIDSPVKPLDLLISTLNENTIKSDNFSFPNSTEVWKKFKTYWTGNNADKIDARKHYTRLAIQHISQSVLGHVQDFLAQLPKAAKFHRHFAVQVIDLTQRPLQDTIQLDSKVSVNVLGSLTAKLVVRVCRFACPIFCLMQRRYEADHSYRGYKETMWNLFLSKCEERSDEATAAGFFRDKLKERIKMHVTGNTFRELRVAVLKDLKAKKEFLKSVLLRLSQNGNFDEYIKYIRNPQAFAADCYYDKYMANPTTDEGQTYIWEIAGEILTERCNKVKECLASTKDAVSTSEGKKMSMIQWRNMFCVFAKSVIGAAREHYPIEQAQESVDKKLMISDLDNFESLVANGLEEIEESLESHFQLVTAEEIGLNRAVFHELIGKIWGCPEVCPFCREPCCLSGENHAVKHQCIQHRPRGVGGLRGDGNILAIYTCNYAVTDQSCTFSTPDSSEFEDTRIPLRRYQEYFPDWDIPPSTDMSNSSVYWIWFIAQNGEKLAKHYQAEAPTIPVYWNKITEENAQQSLSDGSAAVQGIQKYISDAMKAQNYGNLAKTSSEPGGNTSESTRKCIIL